MPFFTIVGGTLREEININWSGVPPVSAEEIDRQVVEAKERNLPSVLSTLDPGPGHDRKLAVVGGGPSIVAHLETLKNWDGDIWSINGAYHWCRGHNIASTFIACDPHVIVADWALHVTKALVTTRCHPKVFEVLKANNAEVRTFDLEGANRVISGSSTACCSFHLALLDGYRDVTWFGCESSYPPGYTHAYMHEPRKEELIVKCGDGEFHTAPDFLIQALEMSAVFRMVEAGFKEESGGLLRALIANPKYRITWISEGLLAGLKPAA